MSVRLAGPGLCALLLCSLGQMAYAVNSQFDLLLDLDARLDTGCEVTTPTGSFAGVDAILTTFVETDGLDAATVTGVERRDCINPDANTFGPAQTISAGGWPVGIGNGQAGFNVIETFMPVSLSGQFSDIRLALVATDELGNSSVLAATGAGFPVFLRGEPPLPVPMFSGLVLFGLALVLLLAGLIVIGRRGRLTLTALVCLTAGGAAGAACLLDGQIFDWDITDLLAETGATNPDNGVDIRALFGKRTDGGEQLCFRIDAALVFATVPVAADDDYITVETTLLDIAAGDGLLANDSLAIPEATLVSFGGGDLGGTVTNHTAGATVSIGSDGSLTVNADGSFQFQAETGFEGVLEFNYRIENVAGDSDATVRIEVQAIPAAVDDDFDNLIDETLNVAAPGVLANDSGFPDPSVASFGGGDLGGSVNDHAAGSAVSIAPDGSVVVNADGSLTYSPPSGFSGEFSFNYRIENPAGDAQATITITVNDPPEITSVDSHVCAVGEVCEFSFTAEGFPDPIIALDGDLPDGVTFNAATESLEGNPDTGTGAEYILTVTADNGINPQATQSFTLSVNEAPTITSADSLTCQVGEPCSFTFTADGFPDPTFSLPGLPSGLSLDATTGVLSGTPDTDTGAIYNLTLAATNGIAPDDDQAFTLTINEAPTITSDDNLTCQVGSSCDFTFTADGFPASSFGLPGLPSGLSLDSNTGVLSGTPDASTGAVYNLTLVATNGVNPDANQAFTLTINEAPTITSADGLTCLLNEPCSFTVTADGFPAPTFSLPALPTGLSLDANTGALSGTPTDDGEFNLTLTATNTAGSDNQSFTLTIGSPPTITSADSGTCEVGSVCTFSFTADGTPAPTIDVVGILPAGVSFNAATASLEGTPDAGTGAEYSLTVEASNGIAPDASQIFTLTVNEAPVANDDPEGGIPGNSSPGSVPYHGAFNTVLNVGAAVGVLANDNLGFPQASIDSFDATSAGGGSVVLNADGSFSYTPTTGFTGIDSFGYCIENVAAQNCATVEVAVGVRPSADDHVFAQTLLGNTHIDTANSSNFSLFSLAGGDGISLATGTETNGQAVINAGTGTFSFNPAAGHNGAASFQYTASNGFGGATGTVSFSVQGLVWYFDNSVAGGGDGRLASPFNSLAGASAAAAGEVLFLHTGSGAYSGGITLLNNQVLVGHADADNLEFHAGQSAPDDSLLPLVAAEPVIANAGGHGIVLGSGNGIHGLQVGNTSGFGILGNNFGTLAVSGVSVAGSGSGLHLDTGTVSGNGFNQVNATTGTHGILLTAVGGTVNLGGGSVSGATIAAMELNGGTANVNYAGSLTAGTGGRPALIQNKSGGTVVLTGGLSSSQLGVRLASNTGATLRFAGGMALSTGSNVAFQAIGGGTVEVCDENPCNPAATGTLINTLTTSTATALEVTNTTIGSNRLEFRSISAGTASSGPANAIVLTNTGQSGGLAVTGTGAAGSGGLLRNTTGSAIRATSSHNLTLAYMNIVSPVTTSPPPSLFSGGLELNNLTGNGRFTRLDISAYNRANTHGMTLVNNNTNLAALTLEGITVRDSTDGANAVLVVAQGSSNMTVTIQSHSGTPSSFTSLTNSGVRINSNHSATGTLYFNLLDAVFDGVSTAGLTQPLVMAPSGGPFNFTVEGVSMINSGIVNNQTGLINLAPGSNSAPHPTATGSISANSLSGGGFRAINAIADLSTSALDLTIDNNSIQDILQRAVMVDLREGSSVGATSRLRFRGNGIGDLSFVPSGGSEALLIDVRGDVAKILNTLIGGPGGEANHIVHQGNFEAARVVSGRSGEPGDVVHNVTVRGNLIAEQTSTAEGFRVHGRGEGRLCLNMAGTVFNPAPRTLRVIRGNNGVINVTQANAASLETANPGSSVTADAAVMFNQPACPLP